MRLIFKGMKGCWYFFWGHLFALSMYDRKYLQGKWFNGKLNGLCSVGWEWVTHDAIGRIISGVNTDARFPVNQNCRVICPDNIIFHPDDLNNFQSYGIYFQAIGEINIGKGTYIGPNVGLITSNHDSKNLNDHLPPKNIYLGKMCWIGMNSVILPGIILGDKTIVGAGSVVTNSFPDGNCIIGGNPARLIRFIDAEVVS